MRNWATPRNFFAQLSLDLCAALSQHVRYDTPDEKGETRRQRNERFGREDLNPEIVLPEAGLYLWEWYHDVSGGLTRIVQGQAQRIPPSEFLAWATLTGNIVEPVEYAILRDMDAAFCAALGGEISEAVARQQAASQQKSPKRKR